MATQTFTPGIGRLALDRYDFQDHIDGYDFQHNASAISVSPNISFSGVLHSDVYSSLAAISSELADLALSGKGFLLVGDGYDTYEDSIATPDTPYDATVPALNTYLNDVLNNSSNPLYFRIRAGGVVVIKAGTYKFTGTVSVPPGIILMGEGYGTKIVNQTSTPLPLFRIKADTTRVPDAGVDSTEKFIFSKETIFINLTIADNFLEPTFLGDLTYKNPKNNNSTVPLVYLEEGASLSCENVRFVGKTVYTLGTISNVTSFAIATDSAVPVSTGTRLKILNSSIDGFSIPIKFTASGAVNDNLIITNTLLRAHGFLNGDFASAANNSILKFNACNANIANNYCFGNDNTIVSLAYIIPSGSPPVLQSKNKINISNNNIAIDRSNNTTNSTFQLITYQGYPTLNSSISVVCSGNNFQNQYNIQIDDKTPLSLTSSAITLNAALYYNVVDVSSSTYTVDTTLNDYIILANTNSTAITITLPTATTGRTLIIKDKGNAATNNITLARAGGTGSIEGVAASYVMNADYQAIQLTASSGSWWITG